MSVALAALAVVAGEWIGRRVLRQKTWQKVTARAAVAGKPILVIGDPNGGITKGDYGYGDVCGDLTGCPGAPRGMRIDINDPLPFGDDSHVVFCCYTLELSSDIERSYRELARVAGRIDDLFVLGLDPYEIATYTYPGMRWKIESAPPRTRELRYSPLYDRTQMLNTRTR